MTANYKWRPPSLSKLTPYQISLRLTNLGSEASKYKYCFVIQNATNREISGKSYRNTISNRIIFGHSCKRIYFTINTFAVFSTLYLFHRFCMFLPRKTIFFLSMKKCKNFLMFEVLIFQLLLTTFMINKKSTDILHNISVSWKMITFTMCHDN